MKLHIAFMILSVLNSCIQYIGITLILLFVSSFVIGFDHVIRSFHPFIHFVHSFGHETVPTNILKFWLHFSGYRSVLVITREYCQVAMMH